MSSLSWFDDERGSVAGIYQLNTAGGLDAPFVTVRQAYLRGHLTLRETTEQQNLEVWLRRSERDQARAVTLREAV